MNNAQSKKAGTVKPTKLFFATVDYNACIQKGIVAGRYDFVRKEIAEENFPPIAREAGRKHMCFCSYDFECNDNVESDYIIDAMEQDGMLPATLRELLVFGRIHPAEVNFSVVALGSRMINDDGEHDVACLSRRRPEHGFRRGLCLAPYRCGWYRCRFLAVSASLK